MSAWEREIGELPSPLSSPFGFRPERGRLFSLLDETEGEPFLGGVFWQKRNRGDHRYYLLPGMGRSNRRKRQQYFRSALVVGVIVSVILCGLLYYFSRPRW